MEVKKAIDLASYYVGCSDTAKDVVERLQMLKNLAKDDETKKALEQAIEDWTKLQKVCKSNADRIFKWKYEHGEYKKFE